MQVFVGAFVALIVVLVGPPQGDPLVFLGHAERIAAGQVPYRDFPVEYPPFALLPLVLPRLVLGAEASAGAYQVMFSALSLAMAGATAAVVAWLTRRGWSAQTVRDSVLTYAGLALAIAPLIVWRYDIVPALLTALALVAVASRRPSWAGVMLGFGAAAKIYPAFLVAPLLVYYLVRRRFSAAALVVIGFAVAFGAVVGEALVVAGPEALAFLTYQDDRGVEIESVLGGIVLLSDKLFATGATVTFDFGSLQVASPLIDALQLPRQAVEAALLLGLVAGGAMHVARDRRRSGTVCRTTLIALLMATLLLVILTNKVLSPQYLVWLLPFAALLPRRPGLILLVACVLTTWIYPLGFASLVELDPLLIVVLNLRNAVLLALFVVLLLPVDSEALEPQSVATLDTPPTSPAATPNASRAIATRRRRGRMATISTAANATLTSLANVKPASPETSASMTTIGLASAARPWRSIITRNDA